MKIENKYNIGDKVKYLKKKKVDVWHTCDFCGGSGKAINYLGESVECPECEGTRGWTEEELQEGDQSGEIIGISIEGIKISDENTPFRAEWKYVISPDYGTYSYGRDIVPEHRIYGVVES